MTEERGVIQFQYELHPAPAIEAQSISDLQELRRYCFRNNLVGVNQAGIGFGNISKRDADSFIISGSQTGHLEELSPEHYTRVLSYDIDNNSVLAEGPIAPSSESLSHAACYESSAGINFIAHVHHEGLWKANLGILPTTAEQIEAGVPAMAREIDRIINEASSQTSGGIAMAGHKDGLIFYGTSLETITTEIARLLANSH